MLVERSASRMQLAMQPARTSVLLCRDIPSIFQTLAPFLAAVEIQPDRIEWLPYLGPRGAFCAPEATVAGAARAGKVGAHAWKHPTDLPYTAAPCPRFSTSLATLRSSR
jgi:hypothetical protein